MGCVDEFEHFEKLFFRDLDFNAKFGNGEIIERLCSRNSMIDFVKIVRKPDINHFISPLRFGIKDL
ncbi:hypothetical protein Ab1vBOLIVR5_gp123c [Agrobacterium phage OLIVR5]|uniref:Uncharacterized protein n=1 Tax=Agrobacterium phage OLIVR5 TaxID=2723773 RepID=A0A858MTN3_9CAUD|nr:hypothetical protein KNU99_gp123 [Agrobacterium phage OLIVR5]QIW87771.1 hypothetical protein Ab1vBOLIVR5_gp123c [Agrobacterium phage OLIVR5]QIW88035.1 hypothetical protein Ab1vBOLIVR6_gp128c [Agrobacterium phage OLIVR6]